MKPSKNKTALILSLAALLWCATGFAAHPDAGSIVNEQTGVIYTAAQDAVDALADGETLIFGTGRYKGRKPGEITKPISVVGKHNVTLKSAVTTPVDIENAHRGATLLGLVISACSNVTVENFIIDQAPVPWGSSSIQLFDNTAVTIKNNRLMGRKNTVVVQNSVNHLFIRNIFTGVPYGFLFATGNNSGMRVVNNVFATATMDPQVEIFSNDTPEITNNIFTLEHRHVLGGNFPEGSDKIKGNLFVGFTQPLPDFLSPIFNMYSGRLWSVDAVELNNPIEEQVSINDIIDFDAISEYGTLLPKDDSYALDDGFWTTGLGGIWDGLPDIGAKERIIWATKRHWKQNDTVYWNGAYYFCILEHTPWDPNWHPANTTNILWKRIALQP